MSPYRALPSSVASNSLAVPTGLIAHLAMLIWFLSMVTLDFILIPSTMRIN